MKSFINYLYFNLAGLAYVPLVLTCGAFRVEAAAAEPRYQWQEVTSSAAFSERDGAGALVYDDKMWLLGGWNPFDKVNFPKVTNNEVWNSTNGADWTLVKPNTFEDGVYNPAADWEGRHTAGYAVYDDKMWIIGGDANQGYYQNDVWNSTDGLNWNKVNSNVPWANRALQHTVVHDDKIWVMGGQTMPAFAPAEEAFYNDIWNTTDGVNWTQVQAEGPMWSPRGMIGGSAVMNGRMWILGGGTYDTPDTPTRQFNNDVWSSADGVHWTQHLTSAPWDPRQYHDVAVFDNQLWVMEGWDGSGNRNDVWRSADGVNWTQVPNTPWAPRHAASVYVYDDALWMVTGNNFTSDVWKLAKIPPHRITFESTNYSTGQVFNQDGWTNIDGLSPWGFNVSTANPIAGNHSLTIDTSGVSGAVAQELASGDNTSFSLLVRIDSQQGGQFEMGVLLANKSSTEATIVFRNDGVLAWYDGTGDVSLGASYTVGTVYRVETVLDYDSDTFSAVITDTNTETEVVNVSGLALFGNREAGDFGWYYLFQRGAGTWTVDNLQSPVAVPEPCSLALLGLSVISLLKRFNHNPKFESLDSSTQKLE